MQKMNEKHLPKFAKYDSLSSNFGESEE